MLKVTFEKFDRQLDCFVRNTSTENDSLNIILQYGTLIKYVEVRKSVRAVRGKL